MLGHIYYFLLNNKWQNRENNILETRLGKYYHHPHAAACLAEPLTTDFPQAGFKTIHGYLHPAFVLN